MKDAHLIEDRGDFVTISMGSSYSDSKNYRVVQRNRDYMIVTDGHRTEEVHIVSSSNSPNSDDISSNSDLETSNSHSVRSSSGCGCGTMGIILLVIIGIWLLDTLFIELMRGLNIGELVETLTHKFFDALNQIFNSR